MQLLNDYSNLLNGDSGFLLWTGYLVFGLLPLGDWRGELTDGLLLDNLGRAPLPTHFPIFFDSLFLGLYLQHLLQVLAFSFGPSLLFLQHFLLLLLAQPLWAIGALHRGEVEALAPSQHLWLFHLIGGINGGPAEGLGVHLIEGSEISSL